MDGAIVLLIAVILYFRYLPEGVQEEELSVRRAVAERQVLRNPMLNPDMLHDEYAFMRVANELGFH